MSDAIAGSCRACGRDLVQVVGERTYHPHNVDLANEPCPALLPIGCPCECFSSDVPASEFIPTPADPEGATAAAAERGEG